jgi:hypothetical protein
MVRIMNNCSLLPALLVAVALLVAPVAPAYADNMVAVTETAKPPVIILSTRPALLVTIDGPPEYTLIKGTKPLLLRVINTRVLLLTNAAGRYFLHLYDGFMEAAGVDGPWRVSMEVPREVRSAERKARGDGKSDLLRGERDRRSKQLPSLIKGVIPWIYLSQVPAELVVIDGEPDFISIAGTRLFHARNTAGDLFYNQGDGAMYLLVSGRWFSAASYLGPWEIVPDGALPPDFGAVPQTSFKGRVKRAVPPDNRAQGGGYRETAPGIVWLRGVLSGMGSNLLPLGSVAPPFVSPPPPKQWSPRNDTLHFRPDKSRLVGTLPGLKHFFPIRPRLISSQ